jgi:flagellar motor protein MotB
MRRKKYGETVNVWPAFTDGLIAFVLVLVLMLASQVGQAIQVVRTGPSAVDEDQAKVELLISTLGQENIQIIRNVGRHDITFGAEVIFASGSAELSLQGRDILKRLARSVADQHVTTLQEIQVSGHTDNVPTAPTRFSTNWELSTARATGIVRYLIDSGINPERIKISATGYGEYRPVRPNTTDTNRATNRRIEMRLIYSGELF